MIFLLNFVHFDAIFAYSETDLLILKLILLILKQKSPTDVVEAGGCRLFPAQKGSFYTCQTFFHLTFINGGGK